MRADEPDGPAGPGREGEPGDGRGSDPESARGAFHYRDAQLIVEELALADLANDLAGQAAWVLSRKALDAVFEGPARCVPVGLVGPLEVLSMAAAAGWWTQVVSSHELDLAERAGFPPERIAAAAGWHDDGFVKDALTRGIASLPAVDQLDEQNIERIARLLGVERGLAGCVGDGPDVPAAKSMPGPANGQPSLPAVVGLDSFDHCGGLLAPLLRGGPTLVLDAVWDGFSHEMVDGVVGVFPVTHPMSPPGDTCDVLLTGLLSRPLSVAEPALTPARLAGSWPSADEAPARGDWMVVPTHDALACRAPGVAHSAPLQVMVHGALWRPLDQRPLPPELD